MGQSGATRDPITLPRTAHLIPYALFLSGSFHLIFLYHGWPRVTETTDGKTADKGGPRTTPCPSFQPLGPFWPDTPLPCVYLGKSSFLPWIRCKIWVKFYFSVYGCSLLTSFIEKTVFSSLSFLDTFVTNQRAIQKGVRLWPRSCPVDLYNYSSASTTLPWSL